MKYYIVLFSDGCLQIYNSPVDKKNFRKDAMIYECNEDTTIADISEWISTVYLYDRKIKLMEGE